LFCESGFLNTREGQAFKLTRATPAGAARKPINSKAGEWRATRYRRTAACRATTTPAARQCATWSMRGGGSSDRDCGIDGRQIDVCVGPRRRRQGLCQSRLEIQRVLRFIAGGGSGN
jgi:hypothetical protein